jgi:predicted component of type VI protein secretion system
LTFSNSSTGVERKYVATIDARLKILSGSSPGQMIPISKGRLLIGREDDCHLRPQSEFLSRHHCTLLCDERTLRIRDLASKNGTFVNGHRIGNAELILWHGDIVSVGDFTFLVLLEPSTPGKPDLDSTALPAAMLATASTDGDTLPINAPPVTSETASALPADSTPAPPNVPLPSDGVSTPGEPPANSIQSKPA